MHYLVRALLEIVAWFLVPVVAVQASYAIAKNSVADYLKKHNIKIRNTDWS